MTIYQERDYYFQMECGERLLASAETYYEEQNIKCAIKAFYDASLCFELAKELAKNGDIMLLLQAKDKEYYCLEKIDELETFKSTPNWDAEREI